MWIPLLIGIVIGGAMVAGGILGTCVVQTKEQWHERTHIELAMWYRMDAVVAENAKLRLDLAAGEMTEDAKKVATMTMAALDAVITAGKKAAA